LSTALIRWILFVAFAFTVPVLWFILAAGGTVPLIIILLIQLSCLSSLFLFVLNGINLVLWGALLFYIAGLCTRTIERAQPAWRLPIVGAVLLALIGLTFLPIYCTGNVGGGHAEGNLYQFVIKEHMVDWLIRALHFLRFYISCFASVSPW